MHKDGSLLHPALVAQLVEHKARDPWVPGSNPSHSTAISFSAFFKQKHYTRLTHKQSANPERH